MSLDLKRFNETVGIALSIMGKLTIIGLAIMLLILIFVITNKEGYSIERFEVPKSFEADGTSRLIVAKNLADEVDRIRNGAVYKLTEIHEQELFEEQDSLSGAVTVGGVEFQIENLLKYLRLDNRKAISGELLIRGSTLRLNVRIPGETTATFEKTFDREQDPESRYQTLDALIASAGEFLVEKMNPMILAYSYYSKLTDEGIDKSVELSRKVIESNHPDAKIAHYLIADRMFYHYADTRESLIQLDKALALDPSFAAAWFFKAEIMIHPYGVEIPGRPLQPLELIYDDSIDETERIERAIQFYENGLEVQPHDFFALIDLADVYASVKETPTNEDLKKAVTNYERAKQQYKRYFYMNPTKSASYGKQRLQNFEKIIAKVRNAT